MKTVLLVDDDHICNFLMHKALKHLGSATEVISVLNGQQAIDLINDYTANSKNLPEVIFLDINMPVMDGFAFLEVYNNLELVDKQNVKIIIVSSSNNPNDRLRAQTLGVKDFLFKPVTEDKLRSVLKNEI
jgi:CheY-like chemotaxis protein